MGTSIGLLELKSIPMGIYAADEMLKKADVRLLMASPVCPGKYIIIISGNIGSVKSAMEAGSLCGSAFVVDSQIINNTHESLPAAILGISDIARVMSLGVVETINAVSAIRAGDIAAKASNVQLMEIRTARGLGGKGFAMFTGELSAVESAVKACVNQLADTAVITSYVTISSPHEGLIEHLTS